MYIGDTRAEQRRMERALIRGPNIRDTVEQRRLERDAERLERNAARDLLRVQRSVPLPAPSLPASPSDGSPIVTGSGGDPAATGTDAGGGSASGGSSTVTVTPADAGGGSMLVPLLIGAASLLLLG